MSSTICFLVLSCLFLYVYAEDPLPPYVVPRDCPSNEKFLPCGPSCQTECATLGKPCLIRHFRCPDGCYCNEGYARNAKGTCIPQSQCKNKSGGGYA